MGSEVITVVAHLLLNNSIMGLKILLVVFKSFVLTTPIEWVVEVATNEYQTSGFTNGAFEVAFAKVVAVVAHEDEGVIFVGEEQSSLLGTWPKNMLLKRMQLKKKSMCLGFSIQLFFL